MAVSFQCMTKLTTNKKKKKKKNSQKKKVTQTLYNSVLCPDSELPLWLGSEYLAYRTVDAYIYNKNILFI